MIIKQITPSSWILTSNTTGKKIGIAIKKGEYISLMQEPNKQFETLEQIADHFGEKIVEQADNKEVERTIFHIEGYPIKHDKAFNITSDTENNLHTYRSRENGKLVFVAGYFGVKFKNGWVGTYSPKINTLLGSEYIGPFKDEFELKFQLLKHNREK